MRPLFTVFDLLQLMGPVLGTAAGCAGGYCLFGTVGLVVGGILGLFIGKFLGNLSDNMSILAVHRGFTGKSDVAAITSAFPDMARKLPDYRPSEPVDECRKKVRVVRDLAEQSAPAVGETAPEP